MKTSLLLLVHVSKTFRRHGLALLAGLLLFASPMALSAQTVSYSGTAVNLGSVNVCPAGQTTPPPCSAAQTLTFSVKASGTLGAIQVVTQGATGLDFTLGSGSTCTGAVTKGASCVVNVKFAPEHPGTRLGAVEVVDTSGNVLADVPVYGVGLAPLVTFAQEVNVPSINETPAYVAYEPNSQSLLGGTFSYPSFYAVDASGNVFVADCDFGRDIYPGVSEMTAASGFSTIKTLGSGFACPLGIAVDGSGNVFVADVGNGTNVVKEILAAGDYTTVRTIGGSFLNPAGVALDGSGNVFVAVRGESYEHIAGAVQEILAEGGYTTVKTLGGPGTVYPWGLAVDGSGNLFFGDDGTGDDGTGWVDEIPAAGGYKATKVLATVNQPGGLALDAAGNVFVTSGEADEDYEILAAGGYTIVEPLGLVSFGVATDANGNVLVDLSPGPGRNIFELNYADPPSVSFPTQTQIGSNDTLDGALTVSVHNSGNQPLLFSTGNNPNYPADFPANGTDTSLCAAGASLAAGATCDVSINFIPSIDGLNSGSVALTDNSLNKASAKQSIPASGTGAAGTTPISFPNGFARATSSLSLNGGAAVNGTALELTDGGTFEKRSVFFPTLVGVSSFTTEFDFQSTGEADGFTFVLQANGPNAYGTSGGGLGYGPSAAGKPGASITNSVAVKFDLYDDAGEGSSSTGLYLNGAAPTIPSVNFFPSGIDLHSGDVFHAVLVSDGATLALTIIDKTTNATFTQAFPVDIPAVLGGPTGFVGFTASTGEKTSVEQILNWQFTSTECCTAGEPNFPTGFTDPSSLTINGDGGAAVVGGQLQLTDGATFTATSVFDSTAIPLNGFVQNEPFTSDFDFQLSGGTGDGFTFVLQSQGLNAIGGQGGFLGYRGIAQSSGESLAVKFDLHNNAGEGPNSTGVYLYGESPTVPATDLTPSGINLHNGHTFHTRLTCDGANVKVSITDLTEYAVFTRSYPLPSGYIYYAGGWAGFTAGTGALANIEKILNWTMTSY